MLDVGRHWMPTEVILRTLDCMAVVKLNVLHLHLTEDQGFRIESKTHPRLHELGSDGDYLTQEQIRTIIACATERGIRVVPEFDIPGHASSWLAGYPELGSLPGPYAIVRRWGICSGVLDPTNEAVYRMLDEFLGEMAALFPDRYLHIGGDEVPHAESWDRVPHIQDFIREERLGDHAGLQARFNQRVLRMLERHGKRMVGWDEILHPELPKQSVVHSWRGPEGLGAAARAGHPVILSHGYYIDLGHPTWRHYLNDPLPVDTPLSPEEQARILGGEATMWSEWVTAETVDSRVWPRTAAIAERLWSARDVRDVDDMYRRLEVVSRRLEEAGSLHEANIAPMIRRFAGDTAAPEELAALETLAGLVEPVQEYRRGVQQPRANSLSPLTGLADIARPDSRTARTFAVDVGHALFTTPPGVGLEPLAEALTSWLGAVAILRHRLAARAPRVCALVPLLERSALALETGHEALAHLRESEQPAEAWCAARLEALAQAAEPHDACRLPIVSSLRLLVAAAALMAGRATMPAAEWRRQVEDLAAEDRGRPAATTAST
jgi:hexosaminidase